MLELYKPSHKKIAMGLLSYMPKEKELKKLLKTMERYETDENWQLFLWCKVDFVGVIGVEKKEGKVIVHHISVNPSFRNEGIGRMMVKAVEEKYATRLTPCRQTRDFLQVCEQKSQADERA